MKMKNIKISTALSTLIAILTLQLSTHVSATDSGNTGGGCGEVSLNGEVLMITGTSEADEMTAFMNNNSLYVNHFSEGNDAIELCGPYDSITYINVLLNNGDDYFDGSALSIPLTIYGGGGNDEIYGGSSADTLRGDSGEDTIVGGEGNDMLYGGNDGDLLVGCKGNDEIYGEAGNDFIGGGSTIENPNGRDLYEPKNCSSSDGDSGDSLYGGDGNDFISGGNGEDTIEGGAGHDAIASNDGQEDRVYGGDGNDFIVEDGDGDPDRTDWFKAWGNGGDDFLIANSIRAYLSGGDGNDAVMTVSSNMDVKLYGGDSADYIATEDGLPEGSCGSGDDKGHWLMNSCEGTGWADGGFEELLNKLDNRSNYSNPYYTMVNAFMNSKVLDNRNWSYYGQNEEPEIIYNFPSAHTFTKWNEDRTRNIYDYYSVAAQLQSAPINGVTLYYGNLWCYSQSKLWMCGLLTGPNFDCMDLNDDNSRSIVYTTTDSYYDNIDPQDVCEATTFTYYEKQDYDVDLATGF